VDLLPSKILPLQKDLSGGREEGLFFDYSLHVAVLEDEGQLPVEALCFKLEQEGRGPVLCAHRRGLVFPRAHFLAFSLVVAAQDACAEPLGTR
jgi:hypothetical protein